MYKTDCRSFFSDNDEAYEGDEEEVAKDESDEKQTSLNPAKQVSRSFVLSRRLRASSDFTLKVMI